MRILIAGGTGLIGRALVSHLQRQQHTVTVLGRSKPRIKRIFPQDIILCSWDELSIETIEAHDLIINLCGANIGAQRWSAKRKEILVSSRIQPSIRLTSLCAQSHNKPALFNASAIGIYPSQTVLGAPCTEETPLPDHPEGSPFLARLAKQWESTTLVAQEAGVRVVLMRFGVVLSPDGGILKELKLPYQLGLGGPIGSGRQPFTWIAITDLVNAIDFLIAHPEITGPVNIVAPTPAPQKEFAKLYANTLNRAAFFPNFAWVIQRVFGQMGQELLLNGQNVTPKRLLESGFHFQYPNLKQALASTHTV